MNNTITFPSSNPTIIKGLGHHAAASITQDAIINISLPCGRSLGSICCGVVPDNLFPGHLVLGRTLFHTFGILAKNDGSVQLLRVPEKPKLDQINQGTVFIVNNTPLSTDKNSIKIASILRKFHQFYSSVFKFDPNKPQKTVNISTVEHHIDTESANPIKIPIRRYSPAQCNVINEFLKSALKRKLIRKSKSPWAAPALLAPKKGGAWRFCIDYRQLNRVTKKHAFPLPNIQDELHKAAGKKYYCSFDLLDGFWHIAMAPSSIEKTAFTVPNGLYEWLVMPFGLTNAPSTFQSFINEVLQPLRNIVAGTLDDVCTWGDTIEECAQNAAKVLKRFVEFNLVLNIRKCRWFQPRITFLGFIIDENGLHADPSKVTAVMDRPMPKTVTELRSFLNAAGYLRHFIPGFAATAAPLYSLTGGEKGGIIKLSEDQISSWKAIKVALTSLPVLKSFNFDLEVVIDCDASSDATGGVLLQPHPYNGNTRIDDKKLLSSSKTALYPVAYMSHKFSPTQKRYSTQERELLAVILCLQHWRYWVEGAKIVVRTDHESLAGYRTKIDITPRILRFLDVIEHYNPRIVYRKGITNVLPDYLSRPPFPSTLDSVQVYPIESDKNPTISTNNIINDPDATEDEADLDENNDENSASSQIDSSNRRVTIDNLSRIDLLAIFQALTDHTQLPRHLARFTDNFIVRSNSLFYIDNYFLKQVLDYDVLLQEAIILHEQIGHATAGILLAELHKKYWHPDMILIAQEVIRTCQRCQLMLAPNIPSLPLQPIPPAQPLQRWGIDFTGPIAGYTMLNAIDYATGYGISQLCLIADHKTVINFIDNLIHIFGIPAEIISDNGSAFVSNDTRIFLSKHKIKYHQATPYHPRTNGRCEKFNGIIKKIWLDIRRVAVEITPEEALKKALLIYNSRPSEHGYSPHFLLFGVAPKLSNPAPAAVFYTREETDEETRSFVKDLASRRKEQLNLIRSSVNSVKACRAYTRSLLAEKKAFHRVFSKGDWVLRQRERKHKFEPFYDGPFSIIKCNEGNTYTLMTPGGITMLNTYNGERLFPAYHRQNQPVRSLWYANNKLLKQDRIRIAREAGL